MAKSDDINEKVEEKTGFGTYILKDLRSTGMVLGGTAIGVAAGYGLSRSSTVVSWLKAATQWVSRRFPGETAEAIAHFAESDHLPLVLPGVGAVVGLSAGAIPNTYEHWREGKKEQLRVEEMADDVVRLREERNSALTTLREQAASIKSQNNAIEKILANGPNGHKSITVNPLPEAQADRLKTDPTQGKIRE